MYYQTVTTFSEWLMSESEILEIAKTNKKETPISERIRNVVINLSEEDQTDIMVVTPFYYPRASRG